MSYLEQLGQELAAVGIRGTLQQRIIAEIRDHLECDPRAELGSPGGLAAQFADELGTGRARRAAFVAFGTLAVAGVLCAVAFLVAGSGFPHRHPRSSLLGSLGAGLAALGAQVALVAGTLAAGRGLRRHHVRILPRAEATILLRRAACGLAAGLVALAGLALLVVEYGHGLSRSSMTLALVAAAAGTAALLMAAPAVLSAARLRPSADGSAGDIFDDLGGLVPGWLAGHPWVLALLVAGGVALLLTIAGALQSDGYDGAARGIADAFACLACFALLGRYLGLRRAPA